jgi:hypothetical protein
MSAMKPMIPKLDSVDSIYNYLRESSPNEVVSSTTPSSTRDSTRINNQLKSTKKQKKEKETTNRMNNTHTNSKELIQTLPSGRVKYGPITVNPRKQPSKTLFTGRRSKYEVLSGEEEEKRRQRRERNRIAATKCRVKRDDILNDLELACNHAMNQYTHLLNVIEQLEQRKSHLQSLVCNYPLQPPMVFGNPGFLSTITETPAPPLPPHQLELIANNEEEFNRFLQPTPVLTNSAYNSDQSNYLFNPQPTITMSSGSLERLINSLHSPAPAYIDNNNNTSQELVNSAYGSSTCAQQHSSSSEDDSMPSTHKHPFVY